MTCPKCSHKKTEVYDSRKHAQYGGSVWRRRLCAKCFHSWTTYEFNKTFIDRIDKLPTLEEIERILLKNRESIHEIAEITDSLHRKSRDDSDYLSDSSCDRGVDL